MSRMYRADSCGITAHAVWAPDWRQMISAPWQSSFGGLWFAHSEIETVSISVGSLDATKRSGRAGLIIRLMYGL